MLVSWNWHRFLGWIFINHWRKPRNNEVKRLHTAPGGNFRVIFPSLTSQMLALELSLATKEGIFHLDLPQNIETNKHGLFNQKRIETSSLIESCSSFQEDHLKYLDLPKTPRKNENHAKMMVYCGESKISPWTNPGISNHVIFDIGIFS